MTNYKTAFATLVLTVAPALHAAPTVPLCPGLTLVTAVNQSGGDYESIKTIETVNDDGVRLKYSVERLVDDFLSNDPPKLTKFTLYRTVRRVDLVSATLYEQQFSTELPELIPETTAIGTSSAVLEALKTAGESKLGIFIAYSQKQPSIDRNVHPNVFDNQMVATVTRVGTVPVMIPVILNDEPIMLPAIQAQGDFFGDKTEFFFLDDPENPITLKFRFGIDGNKIDPTIAKLRGIETPPSADKDVLQVVKITARCAQGNLQSGDGPPNSGPAVPGSGLGAGAASAGGAGSGAGAGSGSNSAAGAGGAVPTEPGAGAGAADNLEHALAKSGHVDIYSIYFSFNSDEIRDESEPTLREIADILRRHPDWKLAVNGHTDNIGSDQYNLDLSRRRAVAVVNTLSQRYGIAAARLVASGFGESQPKDTNDTLEGRAKNRRVELVRS
jgi:outer membrane protein OmpA-like peptidoglycan-associated protein